MADPALLLHALILGIIEGLTEFLPVSSTGHLILVGQLLDFNDDKGKVFEIAIQFAAILAVVWEYRVRLWHTLVSMTSEAVSQRLAINLIVSFLPAAVLGFLFLKQIKAYLFNPHGKFVLPTKPSTSQS
jgi:undecaprenyl-diphosphatase